MTIKVKRENRELNQFDTDVVAWWEAVAYSFNWDRIVKKLLTSEEIKAKKEAIELKALWPITKEEQNVKTNLLSDWIRVTNRTELDQFVALTKNLFKKDKSINLSILNTNKANAILNAWTNHMLFLINGDNELILKEIDIKKENLTKSLTWINWKVIWEGDNLNNIVADLKSNWWTWKLENPTGFNYYASWSAKLTLTEDWNIRMDPISEEESNQILLTQEQEKYKKANNILIELEGLLTWEKFSEVSQTDSYKDKMNELMVAMWATSEQDLVTKLKIPPDIAKWWFWIKSVASAKKYCTDFLKSTTAE